MYYTSHNFDHAYTFKCLRTAHVTDVAHELLLLPIDFSAIVNVCNLLSFSGSIVSWEI